MIRVTEIAFACSAVTDMARARAFYEGALGLKLTTVTDTPDGNTLCIHKRNCAC